MFHLGAALLQNLAVSPELTLRPSLSGPPPTGTFRKVLDCVAGANAPAFVERRFGTRSAAIGSRQPVSPELTLRPSLSGRSSGSAIFPGVAGANAPAFVERLQAAGAWRIEVCVAGANAPAFVERPDVDGR